MLRDLHGRVTRAGQAAAPLAILIPIHQHVDVTGRVVRHIVRDGDIHVAAQNAVWHTYPNAVP